MKSEEDLSALPATGVRPPRHRIALVLDLFASSLLVGYALFLMIVLARQGQGREPFGVFFREVLQSPLSLVVHLVVLAFAVFHSGTVFNGMGKRMAARPGERKVSRALVAEINYGIWIIVSAVIFISVIYWSEQYGRGY